MDYSGRSLLSRAAQLTFPSLPGYTIYVHAATPTPPTGRLHLMVHPSAMRAFVHPVGTRLFRLIPSLVSERTCLTRRQFSLNVAACTLARAADQSPPASLTPTGPPVYSRACPGPSLLEPRSAITTRPNHLLPRRDFHPLAYQRSKAAHRINRIDRMKT